MNFFYFDELIAYSPHFGLYFGLPTSSLEVCVGVPERFARIENLNYLKLIIKSNLYNQHKNVIGEILSPSSVFCENTFFVFLAKRVSGARGRASGTGVPPRCHRRGGPGAENAAFSTV